MKKFISIVLLLAVLLSCCACGKQKESAEATKPLQRLTLEEVLAQQEAEKEARKQDPADLYGMIDQTVAVAGVYKIWNAEGVQLMAEHPDADFELLCHIDMKGATIKPIGTEAKPFTGTITGANNMISNCIIEASDDGYLGFVGRNEGKISDLILENVTFVAKDNTKYMGAIAAYSTEKITGCAVKTSVMDVSKAADGAVCGSMVGVMNGNIINCIIDVDVTYTAAGSATIGGLAGICENGKVEFTETYGDLDITGSNKTVGLVAGQAKNMEFWTVAFLGAKNAVDGKLMTNYFGAEESVKTETMLVRDNSAKPLPENVQELRQRVVDEMNAMGTVEWYTSENLHHDCECMQAVCHGVYAAGKLHVGLPYMHYSSTTYRFNYILNEDNTIKDWLYDMGSYDEFTPYMGNDCSGAVQAAWWTVSNTSDAGRSKFMNPKYNDLTGCIMVGDYQVDKGIDDAGKEYTGVVSKHYLRANGNDRMYESYAQLRMGDCIATSNGEGGGHARMVVETPVVVRDENGKIDGQYSYVITTEQGAPYQSDPYWTSWRINYKYTFAQIFGGGYLPITCEELVSGEMEPVEVKLEGDAEGKSGMFTGTVTANYNLESGILVITDSQGNEVLNHTVFAAVNRFADCNSYDNGIRGFNEKFDMARFTAVLKDVQFERGESYNYSISVYLTPGDTIQVKTGSFVQGQA